MDNSDQHELRRRISRLEDEIVEIKDVLRRLVSTLPESTPAHPEAPPVPPPPPVSPSAQPPEAGPVNRASEPPKPPAVAPAERRSWSLPEHMRTGEFWLKSVGIALILFGVAFGFKYSIEQGWINPVVRHLFGTAIGLALAVFGLRLYGSRPRLAQVLLGGSIGTFYITCFSAFQLFSLISHPTAFAGMIAISLGSFWIAIRQDEAAFSLIGTAGALGTPFLLYTGSGSLPALVLYTCLVLFTATAVYFFKGWRLLLWLSVLGGWLVLMIGIETGRLYRNVAPDADHWAMQAGLVFAWLLFWLVPVIRRVVTTTAPSRFAKGLLGVGDSGLRERTRRVLDRHVHLLSIGPAVVALLFSNVIWQEYHHDAIGWATMAAVVLYAVAALYLRGSEPLKNLAFTQAAVGTLLFTIALAYLLQEKSLTFVVATEALALHAIARRLDDKRIAVGGHILFAIVGFFIFWRIGANPFVPSDYSRVWAIVDFWTIACMVASAFVWRRSVARHLYLIFSALLLAMWLNKMFSGDMLFLFLTIETAAFAIIAIWQKDQLLEAFSHAAWGALALLFIVRIIDGREIDPAFFNLDAAINLFPLLLAGGVSNWLSNRPLKVVYRLVVHVGLLAWLATELLPLADGQAFTTVAWGVYGAVILIVGLRLNDHIVRKVGLGTLMLVVAKLFLIDLSQMETIWRVLLFVGFGGVFLVLSYFFPKLWKKDGEGAEEE